MLLLYFADCFNFQLFAVVVSSSGVCSTTRFVNLFMKLSSPVLVVIHWFQSQVLHSQSGIGNNIDLYSHRPRFVSQVCMLSPNDLQESVLWVYCSLGDTGSCLWRSVFAHHSDRGEEKLLTVTRSRPSVLKVLECVDQPSRVSVLHS